MKTGYIFSKRVFDIFAASIAILLCIVPWIIISIVIKIQSPGPVLYVASRVGKNGRIFSLYKFRSMRVDSGHVHATTLRGDCRIFPFGEFLRKSKLDETPQFINILKNDMSIIGPRPEDESIAEKQYKGKYREIISVKPGLSSPASLFDYTVGEKYKDEDTYVKEFLPKKMDMELYYVQNRSIEYDIKIIWRTIATIVQIMIGKSGLGIPEEKMIGLKNEQLEVENVSR